jgi:hypothetical protein
MPNRAAIFRPRAIPNRHKELDRFRGSSRERGYDRRDRMAMVGWPRRALGSYRPRVDLVRRMCWVCDLL